jgi:hypothetical protein
MRHTGGAGTCTQDMVLEAPGWVEPTLKRRATSGRRHHDPRPTGISPRRTSPARPAATGTRMAPNTRYPRSMSNPPRSQAGPPMTLCNFCANGVRWLAVSRSQYHHEAVLSADNWSDDTPVPAWCVPYKPKVTARPQDRRRHRQLPTVPWSINRAGRPSYTAAAFALAISLGWSPSEPWRLCYAAPNCHVPVDWETRCASPLCCLPCCS